jgi:hypothetical protein
VGFNEGIIASNDFDIRVLEGIAQDDTADTAKSVDPNL